MVLAAAANAQAKEISQMHRLNLLSLSGMKEALPPSMSGAIAHTLLETVPAFSTEIIPGKRCSVDVLMHLLQNSRLLYLSKPEGKIATDEDSATLDESAGVPSISEAQMVWRRGGVVVEKNEKLSGPMIVLQGKFDVACGQDNIMTVKKPFDCIGEGSLLRDDYVTDFSATLASREATILRVDRDKFIEALKGETLSSPGKGTRDASIDDVGIDVN